MIEWSLFLANIT